MTAVQAPHTASIEDLFFQGHPLDHVVTAGADMGWSHDDVFAVLRGRQWDLDPSGRLPRNKRVTTPRGLRNLPPSQPTVPAVRKTPATPAKKAARPAPETDRLIAAGVNPEVAATLGAAKASAVEAPPAKTGRPGGRPRKPIQHGEARGYQQHVRHHVPIPEGDPCGCRRAAATAWNERKQARREKEANERAQAIAELATQLSEPSPPEPLTREVERLAVAVELDVWFADAQRSPAPAVRRAARSSITALLHLRIAMDDLARAERTAALTQPRERSTT